MKIGSGTLIILALGTAALLRPSYAADPTAAETAPDNTRVNREDDKVSQPTADQAKQNLSDRDLMQVIRRAIVQDDSLSTYAHNVKIIAKDGTVTLKGPVRSAQEVKNVYAKAVAVAGADRVQNQLTVKSENN